MAKKWKTIMVIRFLVVKGSNVYGVMQVQSVSLKISTAMR